MKSYGLVNDEWKGILVLLNSFNKNFFFFLKKNKEVIKFIRIEIINIRGQRRTMGFQGLAKNYIYIILLFF